MRRLRTGSENRYWPVCVGLLLAMMNCTVKHQLPTEKLSQASFPFEIRKLNDTTFVKVNNTLFCPIRIGFSDLQLQYVSDSVTIPAKTDTTVFFLLPDRPLNPNISMGDVKKVIHPDPVMTLPFPKGRTYRIMQGYDGSFSHNDIGSRFAIDFDLQINDTICSADDGYVVGVISDYRYGGKTREWKPFSNFITVYHPDNGLYTQYVHLVQHGAYVKVGDSVTRGQPIGQSGITGYTDEPHLHFNVLRPLAGGQFESIPIEFENGQKGKNLKKGDVVTK